MNNIFLSKGIRRSLAQIRYVSPVMPGTADGLVAAVYEQAERDFGLVAAPVVMHSPAPAVLAAAWAMLRETLLVPGSVSRAEKEVVAAAVSAGNACPYCVAVHSAAARSLARDQVPAEISAGSVESIADPGLREIAMWARGSGQSIPYQQPVPDPGFPEIAGVAVTFHYLNRMVSVFLPDSPLPPLTPKPVGGWVMDMLASAMVSAAPAPGVALDLLPDAPLPDEFSWAGETGVATALARAARAFEEAGKQAVPPPVRELILGRLGNWNGQPPGSSRAWAEDALAGLAAADRVTGRLALLTAFAPYQVRSADIQDLRRSAGSAAATDENLIGLTAWASMAAARKIGSWLRQP
jgi:AhpD family alkylhydroperoxidase